MRTARLILAIARTTANCMNEKNFIVYISNRIGCAYLHFLSFRILPQSNWKSRLTKNLFISRITLERC